MAGDEMTARVVGSHNANWSPRVVGDGELERLLHRKVPDDEQARSDIRSNALAILSKCLGPSDYTDRSRTGLVIGHIQSGKTLSFTAVAAAAHDNGFRCIAVIAGSSLNLADQNKDRLADDLEIGKSPFGSWFRRHNPTTTQLDELQTALVGWESGPGKTLLLTSLKHYRHVQNLGEVLEGLGDNAAPMLIIDDEADQISLNTKVNQGEESTNYAHILALRSRAPRHTYLQYTATPQANIFIPMWDRLSPQFCEVLKPGDGYVGGERLFIERGHELVRVIDDTELENPEDLAEPPSSLLEALKVFFLGVAQGIAEYNATGIEPSPRNRSMMIHPSRLQNTHQVFRGWVVSARDSWRRLLLDQEDPDHASLVESFRSAYYDLCETCNTTPLASFDSLLSLLPAWIGRTQVREVNARVDRTDWSAEWGAEYPWILVGGQNLDRGFTVEGLTVTYMPRSIGMGQADTIQQRARFFGYKAAYEDLCRVYLPEDTRRAFRVYVRHERSMREFLRRHKDRLDDTSIPRQFELDPQLRPTRAQVLLENPTRYRFKNGWLAQQAPLEVVERSRMNGQRIEEFVQAHGGASWDDDMPWLRDPSGVREDHRHQISERFSLKGLYKDLLVDIVLSDPDEHTRWQVALSMIGNALDEHDELAARVVFMRPESKPFRSIDKSGAIPQVFAGAFPGVEPYAYAGDREVREDDVTLQLHRFSLGVGGGRSASARREIHYWDVPVVALWLGSRVNRPILRQEAGGG